MAGFVVLTADGLSHRYMKEVFYISMMWIVFNRFATVITNSKEYNILKSRVGVAWSNVWIVGHLYIYSAN